MTNIILLIAHPRRDSFNYAIARQITEWAARENVRLLTQDLYADGFNPVLTDDESLAVHGKQPLHIDPLVAAYQKQLSTADILIVVHPNWWGKPPAILSGWLDRVLAPGVAYKLSNGAAGSPEANLRLRSLVITTGDTPLEREHSTFGDPLASIWEKCVLPYIGSTSNRRLHLSPVSTADAAKREAWLLDVRAACNELLNQQM